MTRRDPHVARQEQHRRRHDRRSRYRRGLRAETIAAWLLRLKGYRIVDRRLRTPVGEIDLVARRGAVLAIVEVKARGDSAVAAESVGDRQRRRLERAASWILARQPDPGRLAVRFDVVLVVPRRLPRHLPAAWIPA